MKHTEFYFEGDGTQNMIEVGKSKIHPSVTLYHDTIVNDCHIGEKSSVGDFSKVVDSELGNYVRIDRYNYIWKTVMGNHCFTGKNTSVISTQIGNFVSISWNVSIGGANHDYTRMTTHSFLYNDFDELKPKDEIGYNRFADSLKIGNDVWIAANVVITRNVTIGNGSVIGGGSVVTKNVPDYAIVAGTPARIIGFRFGEREIELLNRIQWWNWDDQKIRDHYSILNSKVSVEQLEKLAAENLC